MILATDASYCEETRMAGIAVHDHLAGRLLAVEVVKAPGGIVEAEALGAIRACTHMATWEAPAGSRVWTDALMVVRKVTTALSLGRRQRGDAFSELGVMLSRHRWTLEHRYRGDVQGAHVAAGGALRAWKAARAAEPTWRRSLYLPKHP